MKRVCAAVSGGFLLAVLATGGVGAAPSPPVADWATLTLLHVDHEPLVDSGLGQGRVHADEVLLAPGRFGMALDCRQPSQVSFSLPQDSQPVDQVSLECWVWLEGGSEERLQRIVGRGSNIGFYVTGRDRPMLTYYVFSKEWKSIRTAIPVGEWVHIGGTFDGRIMRLFVNGSEVGKEDNPGRLSVGPSPYYVGSEAGRGTMRLRGLIDEIRLSAAVRGEWLTGAPMPRPEPTTALERTERAHDGLRRTMVAGRAATPPTLDGRLDDAVWTTLPEARFLDTATMQAPAAPTTVRAAYDDRFLYLAFTAAEKGQESIREGPAVRDDGALFHHDAVDVFLQPGGAGRPYFQIAMNPAGGVFDDCYSKPGQALGWDCEGLRVRGITGFDEWTLEVAIPFAALDAAPPTADSLWRVNFCRNEVPARELSAWAATGGGFHVPGRFGQLRFGTAVSAGGADVDGAVFDLCGTLLAQDGSPVSGVPVRTVTGMTRSDAMGRFRLSGLPRGFVEVAVASPRYEPVLGRVQGRREVEILAPIVLTRIDPYRPSFFPEAVPRGEIVWLASSIEEPPDMHAAPDIGDLEHVLDILATPGEYESRAVSFYTRRELGAPEVGLTAFADGARTLPVAAAQVRWTQRLLKRVQYTRVREDAVFSWRFLWPEAPEIVPADNLRQLVVTVRIPEDARPGRYRADLVLTSGGRPVARLPVRLRVLPFILRTPRKRVGCYYRGHNLEPERLAVELEDIHAHGGRVLVWHASVHYLKQEDGSIEIDVSEVRDAVEMQRRHGLGPPFIVGTRPRQAAALAGLKVRMEPAFADEVRGSAAFKALYARAMAALEALEDEMAAGEFVYTWMDEIFGRGRFEPWVAFAEATRDLTDNRIYITFHNRRQEPIDEVDPWVDLRCYHGHTLDWWQGEGHSWADLAAELRASGDEAWCYYNIREIAVTSEWVRLCNGYWLWRSPLMAHTPWIYHSFGGSPFDDLDADRHDFAYAAPHPTRPEMISSLEWECFREGYDDLRYVYTLEQLAAERSGLDPDHEAVRRAHALLAALTRTDTRVPVAAAELTAADYVLRRDAMARIIQQLLAVQ